jgi:hypothetical protein
MTDDIKNAVAEEVARQLAELKAKEAPPQSTFVPESDAEHQNRVHQMRERQANTWMPPNAVREMVAAEPSGFMHDVALRDTRAPNSPGMISRTEGPSNVRGGNVPGSGTGWQAPTPLSNPPGVNYADKLMDEQDRRDRAELAQRLGALK